MYSSARHAYSLLEIHCQILGDIPTTEPYRKISHRDRQRTNIIRGFCSIFPREKKIENARKWRLLDVKRLREGSLWIRIISEHACACPVRSASKQGNNKIESYFSRRPTIGLSHSKRRLRHCRRHGRAMHWHFYSSYFSYFPRVSRPRDSRHTR